MRKNRMKRCEPWAYGVATCLGYAFLFIAISEGVLQFAWLTGFKGAGFWIENGWKVILTWAVALSPLVGLRNARKNTVRT